MEASALPRSAALPRPRLAVPAPLLRLRSDDQLIVLFRSGSDEAFRAIHDRYRVRLLAYARQMLGGSTADAEDVLQEVFVRAHAALLASSTPISLRAWLYRIAHNRCIDTLRRPAPIPSEITPGAQPALCRGHRHDPPIEAERSEDLQRLVTDVRALPEQQRSALLMRELQGLSYEEMAVALGISVAAVKSVLLRARGGVLDAAEARDAPCADIRVELVSAHDRGVRASGRARRHLRDCDRCCAYRGELRSMRRQVAALAPAGPFGHLGLVFGLGGGGAGGGLAAGSSTAVLGGAAGVTATKVAALVCCAALVGGAGALRSEDTNHQGPRADHAAVRAAAAPAAATAAPAGDPAAQARIAGGTIGPAARRTAAAPTPTTAGAAIRPTTPPLTGQDSYAAAGSGPGTLSLGAAGASPAATAGGAEAAPADATSGGPDATNPTTGTGTAPANAAPAPSPPAASAAPTAATAPPGASASTFQNIDQRLATTGAAVAQAPAQP